MRLRDMAAQHGALEELTPGVEQVMERTAREVKESLNRIQAREKELNHDVDDGARDFRQEQDVRGPACARAGSAPARPLGPRVETASAPVRRRSS